MPVRLALEIKTKVSTEVSSKRFEVPHGVLTVNVDSLLRSMSQEAVQDRLVDLLKVELGKVEFYDDCFMANIRLKEAIFYANQSSGVSALMAEKEILDKSIERARWRINHIQGSEVADVRDALNTITWVKSEPPEVRRETTLKLSALTTVGLALNIKEWTTRSRTLQEMIDKRNGSTQVLVDLPRSITDLYVLDDCIVQDKQ